MKLIDMNDSKAITTAVAVLKLNGLLAFPTDTVYGLAANPQSAVAMDRLFTAKGRDRSKPSPIMVNNDVQIKLVTGEWDDRAQRLAAKFWPGALTIIVARNPKFPDLTCGEKTVGVRQPSHPFVQELLEEAGPLAVTSANLSGEPAATTAGQVIASLRGVIDLVIDGGDSNSGISSTVVDLTVASYRILRLGDISEAEVRAALSTNC